MKSKSYLSLVLMGALALALASCAPPKKVTRATDAEAPEDTADTGEYNISDKEFTSIPDLQTVYFDLDRDELTAETRTTLQSNADYLKANSSLGVLVEGHCDERGTVEYNLALGQRRASVVRKYYVSLGVKAARLGTVSYGEERPAVVGSNESAWSQNRRADTKVKRTQQAFQKSQ